MKKYFMIAAAAVLALASCQKEEQIRDNTVPDNEIVLKSVSGMTKSAINGTSFPADYDMLVSAYRNLDADHKGEDNASNFFEGIKFSQSGTIWKGATPKYWPLTGKLDFLCIASAGLKATGTGIVPVCEWKSGNVASEVVVSVPANSQRFDDLMYGASNDQVYVSSGNSVQFKHAQAAVVFTAKSNVSYDATTNVGITIDKITIDGAKYSGTLTVSNPAAGGGTGTLAASWTELGSAVEHQNARVWDSGNTGTNISETVLTGLNLTTTSALLSAKPFGEAYVILPEQAMTAFTVTYTIHNGMKADGTTKLDNQLQYQYTPAAGTWLMGKKYVYDINITLNEITVSPSIVDWNNQTAIDIPIGQ